MKAKSLDLLLKTDFMKNCDKREAKELLKILVNYNDKCINELAMVSDTIHPELLKEIIRLSDNLDDNKIFMLLMFLDSINSDFMQAYIYGYIAKLNKSSYIENKNIPIRLWDLEILNWHYLSYANNYGVLSFNINGENIDLKTVDDAKKIFKDNDTVHYPFDILLDKNLYDKEEASELANLSDLAMINSFPSDIQNKIYKIATNTNMSKELREHYIIELTIAISSSDYQRLENLYYLMNCKGSNQNIIEFNGILNQNSLSNVVFKTMLSSNNDNLDTLESTNNSFASVAKEASRYLESYFKDVVFDMRIPENKVKAKEIGKILYRELKREDISLGNTNICQLLDSFSRGSMPLESLKILNSKEGINALNKMNEEESKNFIRHIGFIGKNDNNYNSYRNLLLKIGEDVLYSKDEINKDNYFKMFDRVIHAKHCALSSIEEFIDSLDPELENNDFYIVLDSIINDSVDNDSINSINELMRKGLITTVVMPETNETFYLLRNNKLTVTRKLSTEEFALFVKKLLSTKKIDKFYDELVKVTSSNEKMYDDLTISKDIDDSRNPVKSLSKYLEEVEDPNEEITSETILRYGIK